MTTKTALLGDRYELGRTLGRGSFAQTYEARDSHTGRQVAIKILDPREAHELKVLELFEREAAVMRGLRHQGVPEVFEVTRTMWNGTVSMIVMELVEGESLQKIIDARPSLDPGEVMHLFLEMLGILEYIHGRVPPVLHRDIKPANIIVRPNGVPALVDFGSARNEFKLAEEAGSTVAGTYGYMPYEQYMGQATPASDIFALGATFLHLLTGRPPRDFMGSSGNIEVPVALPGDERLGPILQRMLSHSANERFQSARDVRQATLPTIGTSLVAGGAAPAMPARRDPAIAALPGVPRVIDAQLAPLAERLSPGALEMMYAGEDLEDSSSFFDWASLVFFSVITVGVLPITYMAMAGSRRRRVRHFLEHGRAAVARIDKISTHKVPFDVPMAKVRFEFSADGQLHRASDIVMPERAERWRDGEEVQVLYDPNRDYAAIIIS